jgi:hypothetical protein
MVMRVACEGTINVAGAIPVMTGGGWRMVKVAAAETPPPGTGLATVTFTEPALARSAAVNAMVSWVALCTVVGRGLPANEAMELCRNPVPVTTTLRAPLPAVTDGGESEVIEGTGLSTTTLGLLEPEVCPSGLATEIAKEPPIAAREAGTTAFSSVALTYVVARLVAFQEAALPETKPLPLICRAKAAEPAGMVAGATEVIAGGADAGVPGGFGVLGGFGVVPATVPPPQPMTTPATYAVKTRRNSHPGSPRRSR